MGEYCMYCDIANKANKSMAQTIDVLRKKQDTLIKALEIVAKNTTTLFNSLRERNESSCLCCFEGDRMKIAMVKMPLSDYMDIVGQKNDLQFQVTELEQTLREVEESTTDRIHYYIEEIEKLKCIERDYKRQKVALSICVGWMENTPFYFFKGNEIPDSADMSAERDKRAHYEVLKQAKESLRRVPKQDQ